MSGLGWAQRKAARDLARTGPSSCNKCPEPQVPGSIFCAAHKAEFEALAERMKTPGATLEAVVAFCERTYWGPVRGASHPPKLTAEEKRAKAKAESDARYRRASELCDRFEAAGLRSAMFDGRDGTITLAMGDAELLLNAWQAQGGWPRACLATTKKPEGT